MRIAIALSATGLLTAALVACSASEQAPKGDGADESNITAEENSEAADQGGGEEGEKAATSKPSDKAAAPKDPAAAPSAPSLASGGASDGARDGGAKPAPAPPPSTAGTQCEPTSIREVEGNNTAETANQIQPKTATYCGRIEPGDVDHVAFVMPQQITAFSYKPEAGFGAVRIEATAGGEAFDPDGNWPFAGGQKYVFKLSAPGDTQPVDYRLRFTFEY